MRRACLLVTALLWAPAQAQVTVDLQALDQAFEQDMDGRVGQPVQVVDDDQPAPDVRRREGVQQLGGEAPDGVAAAFKGVDQGVRQHAPRQVEGVERSHHSA